MNDLTLENLPKAFAQFLTEWQDAKKLLLEKATNAEPEPDRWFDLPELCEYHPDKPAIATVYGWVHECKVPFHKGAGQKKLRFRKSEIDNWLSLGRNKTFAEAAAEADSYLSGKKKKGAPR
jgi:predicted DNA-binding transcriptional regulator AlpA